MARTQRALEPAQASRAKNSKQSNLKMLIAYASYEPTDLLNCHVSPCHAHPPPPPQSDQPGPSSDGGASATAAASALGGGAAESAGDVTGAASPASPAQASHSGQGRQVLFAKFCEGKLR